MNTNIARKIKVCVDQMVPKEHDYEIYTSDTGIDDMLVLRIITNAWRKLGKAERIAKVQSSVLRKLEAPEKKSIFRFSVVTPEEWREIRLQFVGDKPKLLGYRRSSIATH